MFVPGQPAQTTELSQSPNIILCYFLRSQGKDGFVRVWANTLSSYQLAASIETPAIGFCKVSTLKKGRDDNNYQ